MSNETEGCARLESEAQIADGKLVISLRIGTLAHAARHSDYFDRCAESGTPLKITDEAAFAQSVAHALNAEEEDGSTPITRMLDNAFEHVSEWGEDGIEERVSEARGRTMSDILVGLAQEPQTLDQSMQQPRAMAQIYMNGYNAGVAHERLIDGRSLKDGESR